MTRVETVRYPRWDDFKHGIVPELFGAGAFERGRFIFRGQRSADWALVPSFDRWMGEFPGADPVEIAERMLGWFRDECAWADAPSIPRDILDDPVQVMALGQHYGLPTRLLDWSESPYVAAFFAFSDAIATSPARADVAVWALNTTSEIWLEGGEVRIVRVPSLGNRRLRNQEGLFTLSSGRGLSLDEYAASSASPRALVRFQIPVSEARRAMADLDVMGISPSRMYPELVGTALAARMRAVLTLGAI